MLVNEYLLDQLFASNVNNCDIISTWSLALCRKRTECVNGFPALCLNVRTNATFYFNQLLCIYGMFKCTIYLTKLCLLIYIIYYYYYSHKTYKNTYLLLVPLILAHYYVPGMLTYIFMYTIYLKKLCLLVFFIYH
jgi:hypothetical protein